MEILDDGSVRPLNDTMDWDRFRNMTDDEILAAAMSDPDALPTPADRPAATRVRRARILQRDLSLTQEEFALRYRIPLGTLRDWEQGRCEPDQPTRAYLTVIANDPEGVVRALSGRPTERPAPLTPPQKSA